jgi:hypothetical protein
MFCVKPDIGIFEQVGGLIRNSGFVRQPVSRVLP